MRGFFVHASRSASLAGGLPNKVVVSKVTHSAPDAPRTFSSSCSHRGSAKNARCRTSTQYRYSRGRRRRNPLRAPRPAGLKDGGSCTQRAWARSPRGSMADRKARSGSSTSARRRSWVICFGSLRMNRKPGAVCSAHDLSLIHISEPTRLGMISYAVFCLKKKKKFSDKIKTVSNLQVDRVMVKNYSYT